MARPALTRARIVGAATEIVTNEGLGALSLRSVARRVNATVMGVQRQISFVELIHAVVAEILPSMPVLPPRGDWTKRLRTWALDMRAWLMGYAGVARHLLDNRWDLEIQLDRIEAAVEVLAGAGVGVVEATESARALYWYVLACTDLDESTPVLGAAYTTESVMRSPSRWPRLSSVATPYSIEAAHAQFEFGLDLLLDGMKQRARDVAKPANSRPPKAPSRLTAASK